jgi:hypothetical protein
MAVATPPDNVGVYDPTRDPDSYGTPAKARRYWASAGVGLALLAAVLLWLFLYFNRLGS